MTPLGLNQYNSYGSYAGGMGYQNAYASGAVSAGFQATGGVEGAKKPGAILNPNESTKVMPGKKSSPAECQTCKERKYQDGSNEANVSFKAAAHVSPEAAGTAVRAHEGQHVANAYKKAAEGNGTVLQASVSIHTAVCPECGRTYVSGGTTDTKIRYGNEKNPYVQNAKNADRGVLAGMNFDARI